MISEIRLGQIIATITELSEEKKKDLYKFLIDLKNKADSVPDDNSLAEIREAIRILTERLTNKVDKIQGKGLSSNDFTNELRTKLVNIVGNVQANWNTTDQQDPSYIANKPDLSNVGKQSDWNETDVNDPAYIKNKPSLTGYEVTQHKVTTISSESTDEQYPSAKCVYDIVGNIESVLDNILGI